MRSALITGGAGFIGSHLTDMLVHEGWTVRVLDNLSTGRKENLAKVMDRLQFIEGDINDARLLSGAMEGVGTVFHLAAKVFVPESFQIPEKYEFVNFAGTVQIAKAAQEAMVNRLVLSSTCAVYGDAATLPISESTPTSPLSPYASTKLAAESAARNLCAASDLKLTILRYFNVYGARQNAKSPYSGVLTQFISAALENRQVTIFGDGEQTRDFIHVTDVARANMLAAIHPTQQISCYNVGTGHETSVNKLWNILNAGLTASALRHNNSKPNYEPARPGEIRNSLADISKITSELDFVPNVRVEQGVLDLLR